jgi:cobalamin biosynthesis Co2+ chelatase CbiK
MTRPVENGTSTASSVAPTTLPSVNLDDVVASTIDGYPASLTIVVRLEEGSARDLELFEPLRMVAAAFLADHTSTDLLSDSTKKELSAIVVREAAMLNRVAVEAAFVTNLTITL